MAYYYNFLCLCKDCMFQRQTLIVSHLPEPPVATDTCAPQRFGSEPLLGDQERVRVVGPAGGGNSPGVGQLTPLLPADGACGLPLANRASWAMLSQDIPGREAQRRPPGDGAPSDWQSNSWSNRPPGFRL